MHKGPDKGERALKPLGQIIIDHIKLARIDLIAGQAHAMAAARQDTELAAVAMLPHGLRHRKCMLYRHLLVGGGVPDKQWRGIGRDITLARIRRPILRVGAAGAAGKGGPAIKLRVSADHGIA